MDITICIEFTLVRQINEVPTMFSAICNIEFIELINT